MYTLGILLAAIATMILGSIWYSPLLFGERWMKLMGITKESLAKEKQKEIQAFYAINFIADIVSAFILSRLIVFLAMPALGYALLLAFLVWLGFAVPILLGSVLWEGKPLTLFYINAGYRLASFLLMALVVFGISF
jgi:hypothetical protein